MNNIEKNYYLNAIKDVMRDGLESTYVKAKYKYDVKRLYYSKTLYHMWIMPHLYVEYYNASDTFGSSTSTSSYKSLCRIDGEYLDDVTDESKILEFIDYIPTKDVVIQFLNGRNVHPDEFPYLYKSYKDIVGGEAIRYAFMKRCEREGSMIYRELVDWESISPYGGEDIGHISPKNSYIKQQFENNYRELEMEIEDLIMQEG